MENTPPVPVKTKTAAWLLIAAGVYFAAVFLYGLLVVIFQTTEFKSEAIPVATGLAFIAFIVAIFSFLAGLPLFAKQKRRILLHASIVFLAAYATLFSLWRGLFSMYESIFNSIGCNVSIENSNTACMANGDAFSDSLNLLFYSTAGTIVIGFFVLVLVFAGLKIIKSNKNWWKTTIVLMAINILTLGNAALLINEVLTSQSPVNLDTESILQYVSLGFSLIVATLLLLDRKKFFGNKTV